MAVFMQKSEMSGPHRDVAIVLREGSEAGLQEFFYRHGMPGPLPGRGRRSDLRAEHRQLEERAAANLVRGDCRDSFCE
jgi:hypothetical protein